MVDRRRFLKTFGTGAALLGECERLRPALVRTAPANATPGLARVTQLNQHARVRWQHFDCRS